MNQKTKLLKLRITIILKKTNLTTLEILGMEETFHKEFSQSSFVETVQINSEPKYGWSTIPVVFSINHDEFGDIGVGNTASAGNVEIKSASTGNIEINIEPELG